jgi:hypothetical protein
MIGRNPMMSEESKVVSHVLNWYALIGCALLGLGEVQRSKGHGSAARNGYWSS